MKLKTKIFLSFTAISIIPLLFLMIFSYYQYVNVINGRMNDIISTQFNNISYNVNTSYRSIQQAMKILTFYSNDDSSIINILKKVSSTKKALTDYEIYRASCDMNAICENVCYNYDYINGIYVFTSSGSLISHSIDRQKGDISYSYNPTSEEWYQDTLKLEGETYISGLDVYPMFQTEEASIFFARSILDISTHKSLGIIVLNCSPSIFNLDTVNALGNLTLITLSNTENQQILFTNLEDTNPKIIDNNRILSQFIPDSPLKVELIFDYNSLLKEYHSTGIFFLLLVFLCIICIIIFTYKISGNFINPISQLSDQMLQQKSSSLSYFLNYSDRKDEIGTLYRKYNCMIEELNQSIKKDYQNKLILLDAQMKALEARINSHFLFNTLESINSMAEIEDNEQIATMALSLGNMFRYAIKTESELVTLQDELDHVNDYVAIQSIRFDNKFQVIINVPEEIRHQKMLKLLLQPLVENALSHGLNYCSCGDKIEIQAHLEPPVILISISDNGQGIPKEKLFYLQKNLAEEHSFIELGKSNNQSIGLKNIQSRIELYYGRGYGLSIHSILGYGTSIILKLPILSVKEEVNRNVYLSHN